MYVYYNANPLKKDVSDCTVRAISKAEGKTWDETYEKLTILAQKDGILLDNVDFIEKYLDKRYVRECHFSKTVRRIYRRTPIQNVSNNNGRTHNVCYKW